MVIPINYRRAGLLNPSYDYIDTISGCGYRTFYGACSLLAAGVKSYILTQRVIESSGYTVSGGVGDQGIYTLPGAAVDIDFDITINKECTVGGGKGYVNLSYYRGAVADTIITINVYHVRGVTETLLGTTAHREQETDSQYYRLLIILDLTSKTFNVGDKLRLNVTSNTDCRVYHDPSSATTLTEYSTTRTIGTDLTFDCPFKLEA